MSAIHTALLVTALAAMLVAMISFIRLIVFMRSGRRSFWAMSVGFEVFNAANYRPQAARTRKALLWSVVVFFICILVAIATAGTGVKS